MDTLAVDPIAALHAAGEGRFEWAEGRLLRMEPASDEHNEEVGFLYSAMRYYAEEHDAGRVQGDNFAERLQDGVARVPDLAFFKKSSLGRIKPTHSEGGADLVVEIVSPDSRRRDREEKYREYEEAGVEEYWIVDPERRQAEFFRLREGVYERVAPDSEGRIHSSVLSGFFIRVEWLWDRPRLREVYQELGLL